MGQDEEFEYRYCPKCASSFRAKPDHPHQELNCPKCKARVKLFTFPSIPPRLPVVQKKKSPYQSLMFVGIALAVFLVVVAIGFLLSGNLNLAVFCSLLMLLVGLVFVIFSLERNSRVFYLENHLQNVDEIKQELVNGIEKWNALSSTVETIKEKTVSELQAKWNFEFQDLENQKLGLVQKEAEIEEHRGAVQTVAEKYVKDLTSWTMKNVTSNNFATSKTRIEKAIEFCRKKGAVVTTEAESEIYQELRTQFEEVVRKEAAKQEQQRIKERIREEQKAQAEIERELQLLQSQQAAIRLAIEKALARTQDEHSAEVEELKQKLQEAEEKSRRALSMAQQTRAGYVYVISNIGSFGSDVFKIGMTRRLQPLDRVKELGDASVPFPFDVHMMISCDDAPSLEKSLHRLLHNRRINKVNFRKEFFRVSIEEIREIVEANHGVVEYVATPDALEFNEGLAMDEEDQQFVESVLEEYQSDED